MPGMGGRHWTPCHKSLSASLAFLPRKKNRFLSRVPGTVTKAFRLLWHFCLGGLYVSHAGARRGHKSLSASLAFLPNPRPECSAQRIGVVTKAFRLLWHFCPWRAVRQPHGLTQSVTKAFRLLWHFCQVMSLAWTRRWKSNSHKSLSASLAFLPRLYCAKIRCAQGVVTKAFRLLWHFCPERRSYEEKNK